MSDTSLVFNLVARDRTGETLSGVREKFDSLAEGIGLGAGAAIGASILEGLNVDEANDKLAAQLGLTQAESGRIGSAAGHVYADAYGESMEEVNTAVGSVMSSIKGMSNASSADLETATEKALNFAKTFDVEVDRAVQTAGTLINSGLAKDSTQAFDLITAASQRVPASLREDVLDASDEYSQFFNTLGYSGEQAFALLVDGSKKGTFGIDKAGDAIKEFTIRSTDMSASSTTAYKAIGLDAKTMSNAILAGGSSAQGATQKIIDGLLGIKDPSKQAQMAIALFGTPLEDINVKDIPAFLTSLKGGSGAMDGFGGAAKRSGDALRNNAATAVEEFKRKALTAATQVGGKFAQFAMDNQSVFKPLAYTLLGLAATVLIVKGAMITYSTISAVVSAANAIISSSAWGVIGAWTRMMAIGIMAYVRIAASAVTSALATAAAWTGSALASIGTWILSVIRAGAVAAGQFLLMAARAVIWAATMAAQWLIAMGPIGWIILAVIALTVLIIANWDKVKAFTIKIWGYVWSFLKGVASGIVGTIKGIGRIPGMVAGYFGLLKNYAVQKATALVVWMRSWPGSIAKAVGGLGSLLTSKGRAVVQGLWSGIQSMGGWIKSKLIGWARSMIPAPIAKALGIASPSKVTTAQGRWIARGLIAGMTGSSKQVKAASGKLADIVADALAPGKKRSAALSKISSGSKALVKLANREASVAARMKTANKRVADLIKDRDKLAADVKKGVLDAANITQQQGSEGPATAGSILAGLQDKLARAKQFAADLAQLRKKGISGDLIKQIAQAGVEQGSAAASALASADKNTVKQINSTQGSLVAAADKAGSVAGTAMYGAGIQAAQGIVKGLKQEQASIEKQMLKIATGMQKAIRKALGIHSPSTLMADTVGRFIPSGVVKGMEQTTPQLEAAMRGLVQPQQAVPSRPLTAAGMAPLMGASAAGGPLRVVLDVRGADEDLKRMFRKMVRVDGRGSAQTAFGRRNS
ncbi:phage tail tape measure protein [Streptomyces sp. NPDC102487]|uniref:phage tail tape measure protein n=1 Tax=Streptomyces sp. NPDC102487 TaxID=3366182 RepID=UPI003808572B